MILCPFCKIEMNYCREHYVCPICDTEVWPGKIAREPGGVSGIFQAEQAEKQKLIGKRSGSKSGRTRSSEKKKKGGQDRWWLPE